MGERDRELRLPRQVYRLRAFGLVLGALCIGSVLREKGAAPLTWALLFAEGLVWPHVAWQLAKRSADPHRAERINLIVDSSIGGVFVPLMHFTLLPSVLIIAVLNMDKIGWGWAFLGRASAAMATTALITWGVIRPPVDLYTSMPVIAASIPLMVFYPFAVAFVSEQSGRLARERNKAIEQAVLLREQLAHVARIGTLGEMAAGLAHELNQPLTAIHLEATSALALQDGASRDDMRGALSNVADQSMRAGEIVRRMRAFARRGQISRRAVDVGALVSEALGLLDHDIRAGGVETRVDSAGGVREALIDPIEIQQVLVNLIRNAIEAMAAHAAPGHRQLTIRIEPSYDAIRVSISDTGGGIDPTVVARLFHPFQTTKPSGLGLGLSICESLVDAQGGRMGAGPHPAGGAMFYFEVPEASAYKDS